MAAKEPKAEAAAPVKEKKEANVAAGPSTPAAGADAEEAQSEAGPSAPALSSATVVAVKEEADYDEAAPAGAAGAAAAVPAASNKKRKREKNTRAVSCHSLRAQKIKKNQRVLTAEQKVPEAQERHRNARSQSERGRKKSCA